MSKRFYCFVILCLLGFLGLGLDKHQVPTPYQFPDLSHFPAMPSSEGNPVTAEGAELGRHLFYDPILSGDSSFSCSSCHKQEAAFSDAPISLSLGIDGEPMKRNTMPLFNLAWSKAFFWDGRAASIEEQVFHPVRDTTEMDLSWQDAVPRLKNSPFYLERFIKAFPDKEIDSVLVAKAIAQFLRTLISCNSLYDQVLRGETYFDSATYAGFVLINDQSMADCLHCHTTDANALGTTGKFSNNGLDNITEPDSYPDGGLGAITGNEKQLGHFRIPSLRNVAVTAPYMHDGRFKTLNEVLDFYSDGVHASVNIDSKMTRANSGGVHLTKHEKDCILKFLEALTDSTFITDKRFSNPFNG